MGERLYLRVWHTGAQSTSAGRLFLKTCPRPNLTIMSNDNAVNILKSLLMLQFFGIPLYHCPVRCWQESKPTGGRSSSRFSNDVRDMFSSKLPCRRRILRSFCLSARKPCHRLPPLPTRKFSRCLVWNDRSPANSSFRPFGITAGSAAGKGVLTVPTRAPALQIPKVTGFPGIGKHGSDIGSNDKNPKY